MEYRVFGKHGWKVSAIGFGAWAIGGDWGQQDEGTSIRALEAYLDSGGNFIDTAQVYGEGRSEQIIGGVIKNRRDQVYVATKLPPRKRLWGPPSWTPAELCFPADYIVKGVESSLRNLQTDYIDVFQLHTWCESWNAADHIFSALEKIKESGKVRAVGISTPESFPECVAGALHTGCIDSLQVICNLFEQHPVDTLLPICRQHDIAVIARVPFDEGSLTGKYSGNETFPEDDFRSVYFRPENLQATVERVEVIREWAQEEYPDMSMADLALKWVLSHPDVALTIPGMRNEQQARQNTGASDGKYFSAEELSVMRRFAWRRNPWKEELLPLKLIERE